MPAWMSKLSVLCAGLCLVVSGCGDDAPGQVSTAPAEDECTTSLDCPGGHECDDGECVLLGDEQDAGQDIDEQEDGSPPGDVSVPDDVDEDVQDEVGVGSPCDDGDDCDSGYCIEVAGQGQRVCTDFCNPDGGNCPDGYTCAAVANSGADRVFLCFPQTEILCTPCEADNECGGLSDLCLEYADGQFCGRSCELQTCPTGFDCLEVQGPNGPSRQCQPEALICSACFDPDGDGFGLGEDCPGADCQEDDPTINEGAEELCNRADDDCDGRIDEAFDLLNDPRWCGDCDNPCRFEGAEALCFGGECALGPCLENRYDIDGRQDNGCEYFCEISADGVEVCDGLDNDCDGQIDEDNPGGGQDCDTQQEGICAAGVLECINGQLICEAQSLPLTELCNGLDDDCNGEVDNGNPGGGGQCDSGQPGICSPGTENCVDGAVVCVANLQPGGESCNGLDDDCDGTADDGCPVGITVANSDRRLTANGGGGGSAFTLSCPSGTVAVGATVRSGSEIDAVRAICQSLTVEELRGQDPYAYRSAVTGQQQTTNFAGGGGGSIQTLVCPSGSFLHQLRVRSGSRIDQAQFTCARATYNGYPGQGSTQTTDTQTGTYGNNGGTLRTPTRCAAGEFVAGFYGRAGSRVDQLGVLCRAYNVTTR